MAMHVVTSTNDQQARFNNSIVLAPSAGQSFSCSLPMTDMQSVATRPLVAAQVAAGRVVSCTSR